MDLRDIREFLIDSTKYIFVAVTVLLLVIYVVSLQQVVGPSMEPNFNDGDVLILNKLRYRVLKIKRGDVIALRSPDSKNFIKRVIGIPGDHIEYKNNALYINGEKYDEEYLKDTITSDFKLEDLNVSVIPENQYFVMGDNRSNSTDSRFIGLIAKKNVIGKISFRIFPLNKIRFY